MLCYYILLLYTIYYYILSCMFEVEYTVFGNDNEVKLSNYKSTNLNPFLQSELNYLVTKLCEILLLHGNVETFSIHCTLHSNLPACVYWPLCSYTHLYYRNNFSIFSKKKGPYTNFEALQIVLHFINIFS